MSKPIVLFLCQHNAGRSQLGAALLELQARDRFDARSAGLDPADKVNEAVEASLSELGLEIGDRIPRRVTEADLLEADIVVAMKPDLALPVAPRGHFIEWDLPNPATWDVDTVRPLREEISLRLSEIHEALPTQTP